LAITAAIEKNSQHPLASAIVREAEERGMNIQLLEVENFTSIPGKGVQAKIQGTLYYVGSPRWFNERIPNGLSKDQSNWVSQLQSQGKTVMILGTQKEVLALLAV